MGLKRGMPGTESGVNAPLSTGHKRLVPSRAELVKLGGASLNNYAKVSPADVSGAGSIGLNIKTMAR